MKANLDSTTQCQSFLSPSCYKQRSSHDKFKNVACALALVELEEQRMARAWHKLPYDNLKLGSNGGDGQMADLNGEKEIKALKEGKPSPSNASEVEGGGISQKYINMATALHHLKRFKEAHALMSEAYQIAKAQEGKRII